MLLTTIFCFFAPVKDYRKVVNKTRRRLRKPTLPVGRRGSLMLLGTIFCYCPCQHLLHIFLLTARFVTLQNPTKEEKYSQKPKTLKNRQKKTKGKSTRQKSTKIDKRQQKQTKRAQKWQKQTKGRKWRRITTKTCKNCQKANLSNADKMAQNPTNPLKTTAKLFQTDKKETILSKPDKKR